jgi:hypothetical protein
MRSTVLTAILVLSVSAAGVGGCAAAGASTAARVPDDVLLVRDDAGGWGGPSRGITHQVHPRYQAKKVLDLSDVPQAFWRDVSEARLAAWFCVRDYSRQATGETNGFDEAFEIVVNGHVHRFRTDSGVPRFRPGTSLRQALAWHDFAVPKNELVRGPNTILFRKVPVDKPEPDDYLYLGIDTSVPAGRSWVRFAANGEWRQDKLTVPGGRGEYKVRLYLLRGKRDVQAVWRPAEGEREDPAGLIRYAGTHGDQTRIEWNPHRLDPLAPIRVKVWLEPRKKIAFRWLDADGRPGGKAVATPIQGSLVAATWHGPHGSVAGGLTFPRDVPLEEVVVEAQAAYRAVPEPIDMAPAIAAPAGRPADRRPACRVEADRIVLENATLRCVLDGAGGRLRLASLRNEPAGAEMVRRPDASALFLVETGGKRYAGSRDFRLAHVEPTKEGAGAVAALVHAATGLEARLTVRIDAGALRMDCAVTNRGETPVAFKLAFPHLSGLAISEDPADDYYFYPWGGGIIADRPAHIRRGYGDHGAIYQVMDLFSPARGAGLLVRSTDADGRYKVLALRKHVPGVSETDADAAETPTAHQYTWTANLPAVAGTGVAYEYLRRTRGPGESFAAKGVALETHPGDWHEAMRRYAAWCHRVWDFRPHPSRLTGVWNMIAAGWGQSPIFRNGAYRTDFVREHTDCIELMSWWEWSPLGPWRTPWDELRQRLGEARYERYKPYYVEDPVTGKTMYTVNRGDYDGYNERWGGLPAFRKAIQTYKRKGALVTLYTDPLLACDNSRVGHTRGKEWGIVRPDGSYRKKYESWNMCHDCPAYRDYVVRTMRRVMRETGADGIRLDEYGHKGAACFNKRHAHTFAEWGCTEWQRAIAETAKGVRQAMDEVAPGSVLTTEHPGYDFLMPFIEGCITYDFRIHAMPLRPLECNLQRFYFPECKAYELDNTGADPAHRVRFWNAVGSFAAYYPDAYYRILHENTDAFESGDAEPLVPTLARGVYANRFRGGGKTLYTVYNATGFTFDGPALAVRVPEGAHVFDLTRGDEAEVRRADGGRARVRLFLPREDVACLAVLPQVLEVAGDGAAVVVRVADGARAGEVRLCGADGAPLAVRPAAGTGRFEFGGRRGRAGAPLSVRLLAGGRLVDAAAVPPP